MQSPFSIERAPRRILLVRLGAVGDLVRTLPAVDLLRRTWPGVEIGWVVQTHCAELIEGHPYIDRLLYFDRNAFLEEWRTSKRRALGRIAELRRDMHAFGPDLAIDFQGCFKSGLAAWLSGAPVRVGFERTHVREWAHLFANVRAPLPPAEVHRVRRGLVLARVAGACGEGGPADLALTPLERRRGLEIRRELTAGRDRPCVALAPFTSHRQAWKRYPVDRWLEIGRGLAREGIVPVITAGPGEEDEARSIAAEIGEPAQVCEGVGLRGLAAFLASADLFVGGDTGPMHIAWGVGTRVVALYGPTLVELNSPWGGGDHTTLAPERRTGRADADRFPGITAGRVLAACLSALEARRPAREPAPALIP